MYSEEFKNKVIEDFKQCPYFKPISRKYGIGRETLKYWLRKENINIDELKEGNLRISESFKIIPEEMGSIELYETILVEESQDQEKESIKEEKEANDSKEKIEFEINGFNIKIAIKLLKEFIRGIRND